MIEVSLKLINKDDINYNQVDSYGYTALILACKNIKI